MKTIGKFGLYSAGLMILLFGSEYLLFNEADNTVKEFYGYLSILISLSFIFFGVRAYRNDHCQGKISFFKAFFVGVLICLLPALMFGLYNVIYIVYIDPDFVQSYYDASIVQMKIDYSGAELATQLADMEKDKELFMSPLFNFFLMTITVILLGIVVSVISAIALRKK